MTHKSRSVEETESIAGELAKSLRGGECIALIGELGAGKTQFVRGLVMGLNGNGRAVCSPTFVLLNIYSAARLKVYHLDAYRVKGSDDFDAIGFTELLDQKGVVVVEWADRVNSLLPANCIEVTIKSTAKNSREITVARPK